MIDPNKPVDYNTMDKALSNLINSAPNFDPKDLKFVDDNTINGEYGFDFYSWKYWGKANSSGSICAVVSGIYSKYKLFRKLQENLVVSN
jgi:hypothetical protein